MTSDTMKVDWAQPLVVEGQDAELVGRHMDAYAVTWPNPNGEEDDKRFCIFDEGGAISRHSAHWNGGRDFRVRNKPAAAVGAEAPETPAEVPLGVLTGVERVERLEALARRLAAHMNDDGTIALAGIIETGEEAAAIVALLPPLPDPDLLKAREIVAEVYAEIDRPELAEQVRAGKMDGRLRVQATIRGIKAGREMGK